MYRTFSYDYFYLFSDLMARYRRSFQNNANNHKAPIVIESSMRASHQIVSHVLNILLEEVIGFTNVIVKDIETMNTTVMLNRIVGCPISRSENYYNFFYILQ